MTDSSEHFHSTNILCNTISQWELMKMPLTHSDARSHVRARLPKYINENISSHGGYEKNIRIRAITLAIDDEFIITGSIMIKYYLQRRLVGKLDIVIAIIE